jgi:3-phenylpropionate/trans-cinnamate dioxygenase ferredoxin reductase subunit
MMDEFDAVIVGGGHGGAQAAASLRMAGFAGSVALLSAEADAPYDRPPLSKDYLAGERTFETMLLRPPAFWLERAVTLRLNERVTELDATARILSTATGYRAAYGALIWAAGGEPRRLACAGHDLDGVHTLRNRADADRMRAELPDVQRAVVIGGGYIGLEAAAVLRKAGKHVTIVEMQDRVLARVAGETLSAFYADEHRAHGADILLGTSVDGIEGREGRVSGVRLAGGALLPADFVVVGIGVSPNVGPLLAAGAAGANGVDVDAQCRTSLPGIFAVGDCAAHENRFAAGRRIRLESVQNAADQAQVAAKCIAGAPAEYNAVPWFWSNQYDLRLQTIGLSLGHDRAVLRGELAARSFSVVYLRKGRVIALDCVNAPRDYTQGKALVLAGARPDAMRLADVGVPLRALQTMP